MKAYEATVNYYSIQFGRKAERKRGLWERVNNLLSPVMSPFAAYLIWQTASYATRCKSLCDDDMQIWRLVSLSNIWQVERQCVLLPPKLYFTTEFLPGGGLGWVLARFWNAKLSIFVATIPTTFLSESCASLRRKLVTVSLQENWTGCRSETCNPLRFRRI